MPGDHVWASYSKCSMSACDEVGVEVAALCAPSLIHVKHCCDCVMGVQRQVYPASWGCFLWQQAVIQVQGSTLLYFMNSDQRNQFPSMLWPNRSFSFLLTWLLCLYLLERWCDRGKIFHPLTYSPNAPHQTKEPGTPSESPPWVAVAQWLGPSSAAF